MSQEKTRDEIRAYGHLQVDGEQTVFVPRYDEHWGVPNVATELDLYMENLKFRRGDLKYISVDVNNMPSNVNKIAFLWKLMTIGNVSPFVMCPVDLSYIHVVALLGYLEAEDISEVACSVLHELHCARQLEWVGSSLENDGAICLPLVFRGARDAPILSRPCWGPLP